jgi:hypothetical protein
MPGKSIGKTVGAEEAVAAPAETMKICKSFVRCRKGFGGSKR